MATKRKTRGDSTDTGAQKPAKAAKPAAPARKRKPAGRPAKASAAAPARPMLPALRLPALTDLMPASDAAVRRATGKGWTEWLAVLDTLGARELPHKAIAKLLAVKLGVPAWWSQMVAVGYERALGRRAVNEKSDGFAANVSKTLYTAAEKAFDAWIDPEFRKRWLPEPVSITKARRPKSLRLSWSDGDRMIAVSIASAGERKSRVQVEQGKLRSKREVEQAKDAWAERLEALARLLGR